MTTILAVKLFVALLFAAVHIFSARLRFLDGIPRNRWLSAAGGVSVAYVFVHLLPELASKPGELNTAGFPKDHADVFLLALAGLVTFYGLERLAKVHGRAAKPANAAHQGQGVFWLHICSFSLYNALIAYLLVIREDAEIRDLLLYGLALGLHFLVNDRGLQRHHGELYRIEARWILAGAVVLGAVAPMLTTISGVWLAGLMAFLAGGIILNVLKEELPDERESRFSAFVAGVVLYAGIVMI